MDNALGTQSSKGLRKLALLVLFLNIGFVSFFSFSGTAFATGSGISVTSRNTLGSTITGYYVVLSDSSGKVVATGFTPNTFATTQGTTYGLQADGYGSCSFSKWSDGITANPRSVTATASTISFSAVYDCGGGGGTGGTSTLTVSSELGNGVPVSGFYTVLYTAGGVAATGFTPATFTVNNGQAYTVEPQDYGTVHFQKWKDTGSTTRDRTFSTTTSESLTAVYCDSSNPSSCTPGGGGSGTITIYDHRIPASYWANCFASTCKNPLAGPGTYTGPGASMWVALYDAYGNVVGTGFSNENGLTFSGLAVGATYYLNPQNCHLCHGSTHDVIFSYWGDANGTSIGTTNPLAVVVQSSGQSFNAWYSCTNGCQ